MLGQGGGGRTTQYALMDVGSEIQSILRMKIDSQSETVDPRVPGISFGDASTARTAFASAPAMKSTTNYYPVIFRAVSRLPSNTREARGELYARAGEALASHTSARRERHGIETCCHSRPAAEADRCRHSETAHKWLLLCAVVLKS